VCKDFSVRCGAYILPLPSDISTSRLPSSLSNPMVIRAYMKYFHLSRGREKFLSWGRKISIFIDDTKVQKNN
jgi:hypothetical protein